VLNDFNTCANFRFFDDFNRTDITPGGSPQTNYNVSFPTGATASISTKVVGEPPKLKFVSAPAASTRTAVIALAVNHMSVY